MGWISYAQYDVFHIPSLRLPKGSDISKCLLPRKIESLRLVPDGKVEVDVRPEVFIDHYPDAEADCRLYILKQCNIAGRIIRCGCIGKQYAPDNI